MFTKRRPSRFYRPPRKKRLLRILGFFLCLWLGFLGVTAFLLQPYRLNSPTMEPEEPEGSRFLASPLVFGLLGRFRAPRRGDLVLIAPPYLEKKSWYYTIVDNFVSFFTLQRIFLKVGSPGDGPNLWRLTRIAAIPGDRIRAENYRLFIQPPGEGNFRGEGAFYPGVSLQFPSLPSNWDPSLYLTGKAPEFFDSPGLDNPNRGPGYLAETLLGEGQYLVLSDNRGLGEDSFDFGPVDKSRLRGMVFFRYWPRPALYF